MRDPIADVIDYRHVLSEIRGVILGPAKKGQALRIINEIVGEALYGDFPGALEKATRDGWILP